MLAMKIPAFVMVTHDPIYYIQVDDLIMWPDDICHRATLKEAEEALPRFVGGFMVSCTHTLQAIDTAKK